MHSWTAQETLHSFTQRKEIVFVAPQHVSDRTTWQTAQATSLMNVD